MQYEVYLLLTISPTYSSKPTELFKDDIDPCQWIQLSSVGGIAHASRTPLC